MEDLTWRYRPRNPWSRRRFASVQRIDRYVSSFIQYLIEKHPSITRFDERFQHMKDMLDHAGVLGVPNKPESVHVELLSVMATWLVPIENLNALQQGLQALRARRGTSTGVYTTNQEFDEQFDFIRSGVFPTGWRAVGTFNLGNDETLVKSMEVRVYHALSSYIVVTAQLDITTTCLDILDRILTTAPRPKLSMIFPWNQPRPFRLSFSSTSLERIKAEEIEDLLLDVVWDAERVLRRECGRTTFLGKGPPATVQLFSVSEDGREGWPYSGEFWSSLGMNWGRVFHFQVPKEQMNFFLLHGPYSDDLSGHSVRVAIEQGASSRRGRLSANDRAQASYMTLPYWNDQLAPLMAIRPFLQLTEVELASVRMHVFATAASQMLSKKGLSKFLRAQRDLNRLSLFVERLVADYDPISLQKASSDFPATKPAWNSKREDLDLLAYLVTDTTDRVKRLKGALESVETAARNELDIRLILSDEAWQRAAFWVSVFSLLVAVVSIVVAVGALYPEDAKRILDHMWTVVKDWLAFVGGAPIP